MTWLFPSGTSQAACRGADQLPKVLVPNYQSTRIQQLCDGGVHYVMDWLELEINSLPRSAQDFQHLKEQLHHSTTVKPNPGITCAKATARPPEEDDTTCQDPSWTHQLFASSGPAQQQGPAPLLVASHGAGSWKDAKPRAPG